jgi:hypothetical protein
MIVVMVIESGGIERQYNVFSDMTVVELKEGMAGTASVERTNVNAPLETQWIQMPGVPVRKDAANYRTLGWSGSEAMRQNSYTLVDSLTLETLNDETSERDFGLA